MIKIKYVGAKKDGERAFMADTGIEWFPGDQHEVSEENAGKMLRHRDVFEQVGSEPVALAAAPKLKAVAADDLDADDEAIKREEAAKKAKAEAKPLHTIKVEEGELVLDGMEPAALHDLAKKLGVKVHHAAGAAKVMDALVASQKK